MKIRFRNNIKRNPIAAESAAIIDVAERGLVRMPETFYGACIQAALRYPGTNVPQDGNCGPRALF